MCSQYLILYCVFVQTDAKNRNSKIIHIFKYSSTKNISESVLHIPLWFGRLLRLICWKCFYEYLFIADHLRKTGILSQVNLKVFIFVMPGRALIWNNNYNITYDIKYICRAIDKFLLQIVFKHADFEIEECFSFYKKIKRVSCKFTDQYSSLTK
jgi:hypothetical protein